MTVGSSFYILFSKGDSKEPLFFCILWRKVAFVISNFKVVATFITRKYMKRKSTVGALASNLKQLKPETRSPIDIQREVHKDYEQQLRECILNHVPHFNNDFFVVIITKKEPLLDNVLRQYFFARQSCPTPDYDQTLWRYHQSDQSVEFLWVIPSKDTCLYLIDNAVEVHPDEKGLLQFVLDFADGSLYALAKKLNGEAHDSNEVVNDRSRT
jgi:galactokinase